MSVWLVVLLCVVLAAVLVAPKVLGDEGQGVREVEMRAYEGMDERQLRDAVRDIRHMRGWEAVHQLIDQEMVMRLSDAYRDAELAESEVRYLLGGAQALAELKATLEEYARTVTPRLDGGGTTE